MISPDFYRVSQLFGRLLFSIYAPITSTGLEHVPKIGPFLLVVNHVSALDMIVVHITCPRRLVLLGKKELWDNSFFCVVAKLYQVVPVDRDNPNTATVKRSLRALRSGTPVVIAPEGTRSNNGKLQGFKPGFLKLAYIAKVPVVPVGVVGTFEVLPRHKKFPKPGRITVNYGAPYTAFLESNSLTDAEIVQHTEAVHSMFPTLLGVSSN
jgi:1-acyl-sn-glycerol-3-phosphate acyltransferase